MEKAGVKKLCPKVILEGTRLTEKTETAFALNEHPGFTGPRKYRYPSPIISAEWCGFTNKPWGRGLINFSPEEESRAVETYRTWLRLFELLPYYAWIVDRFHISTLAYQKRENGRSLDFSWLEGGLQRLGFRIVLLTRKADTFASARERRLLVSGNPKQYDDLEPFVTEQKAMRRYVRQSILPALEIDVSGLTPEAVADRIVRWLDETGGLYAPDELVSQA
jgi:hypothetical protein